MKYLDLGLDRAQFLDTGQHAFAVALKAVGVVIDTGGENRHIRI